jgi:hypothetical protein
MTQPDIGYRAYLLRLWRTPESGWRATLEDPHSGERSAFASLAELLAHLEQAPVNRPSAGPNPDRYADA